ncbi:polynucleotide adenylyltransferase PcnB [Thiohalobacter sp. IOR34]|uniref:polynucleotide adenylyltransferase PcnB n=1 Tax=Thiohalobacter sp. IOR34 TaxID=3057176 RepID=UPI0025B0CE6F|nr:polynucleotide adenylyltransferase PcnB [Thiohalobacter sp. IOR34]WJW74904.1 polynucleotide adenylyltransferase PcnB [Thiohalobacter sp. IOR34]
MPETEPGKTESTAISEQTPTIIPRDQHAISRSNISPNALKVLYRLHAAGYQACLVGGGVRDLLLGREPKDFDVATDAHPEEVRKLFRNCRLIGRRFRLAHVIFGREIIEVATFRAQHSDGAEEGEGVMSEEGRILRDNVYGTIEEDAWRRDFTVNALYYDISDFSVRDFVGGMQDIEAGLLRMIGEPEARYREDPVRMLRAVRFAAKLGFRIEAATEAPITELGPLLFDIAPARLFEEVLKLFLAGEALNTFELLRHYDLFGKLFPMTEAVLAEEVEGFPHMLISHALRNTDERIDQGKPVTPAFLFAALLWEPMRRLMPPADTPGMSEVQAIQIASARIIAEQARHTSVPKRFSLPMREIWALQPRFEQRAGRRPQRLLAHPRFRAAYDFLLLRGQAGEVEPELCQWWTDFQEQNPQQQEKMLLPETRKKRRRRRRKPRSKSPTPDAT